MIDKQEVKAEIQSWPIEDLRELNRKVYVYIYFCNVEYRLGKWIVKEILDGPSSNPKEAILFLCDHRNLPDGMEEYLGYFLPVYHKDYRRISEVRFPKEALKIIEDSADDMYRRDLNKLLGL